MEEEKITETTESVEIDEKSIDAIVEKVATKVASTEAIVRKSIATTPEEKEGEVGKELKMLRFVKALAMNDIAELKAMNEGTSADGGYVVPPAEFIAEVLRLEEQYGVAARNCRVIRTNSISVTLNKKASGVTVYQVDELADGTESKMQLARVEITLKKYMGVSVLSNELDEDMAVNFWNELTTDFAREFAKVQDTLVFTDNTYGLLKIANTVSVVTGADMDKIDLADLRDMVYSVPSEVAANGKFFLHRTVLGKIRNIKDDNKRFILDEGATTILNFPYELVEVLPDTSADALNTPFMVFGDLKNYSLVIKNSMTAEVFNAGVVGSTNLITADAKALRCVQRFGGSCVFPNGFSVLKTAASS